MSFVPFLGADAPRNFPVTLRVESVRNGAQALDLAKSGPGSPRWRSDHDRSRKRGRALHGRADSRRTAVPVREVRRFGRSDVRLAVETELGVTPDRRRRLEFANDRGGVRYGRPEVVDATGRKAAMESSWHDGAIELRFREAFLAEASFPVTIDPTLLTFGLPSGGPFFADFPPDVAYDLASDLYAVVYEEVYSATDHDVFVRTINALGTTVATDYVDFTSSFWAAPKIANNRIAAQFLAVAEKTLSGGAIVIFGRTVPADESDRRWAPSSRSAEPSSASRATPTSAATRALIRRPITASAGNRRSRKHQRLLQPRPGRPARLVIQHNPSPFAGVSTANTNSKPSISKSNGNGTRGTQNWIVVFQRQVQRDRRGHLRGDDPLGRRSGAHRIPDRRVELLRDGSLRSPRSRTR